MRIKITPLSSEYEHMEGIFKIEHNFYLAKYHSAGIITEVKKSDDWLDQEMTWVSRSEIPFITAIRHAQLEGNHLVNGPTPILKRFSTYHVVENVKNFPSFEKCRNLVYKFCDLANEGSYKFYSKPNITKQEIRRLYKMFDYRSNLFVRAGSCLHKAYLLLNTSSTFSEEVYTNLFIAFECIVEYLRLKQKLNRKDVINLIEKHLKKNEPGANFIEYEEEMRDYIRNNIIHPFRERTKEQVAQPFMMADFVFEDLGFVDWLFKLLITKQLQ